MAKSTCTTTPTRNTSNTLSLPTSATAPPRTSPSNLPCSSMTESPDTLLEFTTSGGDIDIFNIPNRAAIYPGLPPALDIHPHPLYETQVGAFLCTIACIRSQLWAGLECGLRYWNLNNVFEVSTGSRKHGDEATVPFHKSFSRSPTLSLVVDATNELIWSDLESVSMRDEEVVLFDTRNLYETRIGKFHILGVVTVDSEIFLLLSPLSMGGENLVKELLRDRLAPLFY